LATGWSNKTTELTGEHLVAAKLCRFGFVVSLTPKNVPDVDILVTNEALKTLPIQLKTIKSGTWQMDAKNFLEISFDKNFRQTIQGKLKLKSPNLPFVMVKIRGESEEEFYVCLARHIQQIVYRKYSAWLKKNHGLRPKNPKSTHSGIEVKDLVGYRDRWKVIKNHPALF
jgi:hypothetical protein